MPVTDKRLLREIVGQSKAIERLSAICDYCERTSSVAEHFLIVGAEG
jgi:hypothetical protein